MVRTEHINPSIGKFFHDEAVAKESSYPEGIDAHFVLGLYVDRLVKKHHFDELMTSLCHRTEKRIRWKLAAVDLFEIQVDSARASKIVK